MGKWQYWRELLIGFLRKLMCILPANTICQNCGEFCDGTPNYDNCKLNFMRDAIMNYHILVTGNPKNM